MIDEDSDWISIDAAVAYVEETLHCYREKARELVRKAVNNLKVKSRTVHSSPKWLVSVIAGQEAFHSDHGESIKVCRKDVVEFCLQLQHAATQSSPRKSKSALWNNVTSAIADLWPDKEITERAKVRNDKIHEWLKSRGMINKFEDVTRTIQRVLREQKGHG
ncbi:MAG: hypothetical protein ACLQNV_23930 [Steroidobacteraceae bacterium]